MSRAFVRESDDVPQLPELPPLVSPLPPGAKNYMTPGGAERLKQEISRLAEERPRLVSAPADDIDAKRELQVLDQRLRYLQESLRTAEIVTPPEGAAEVVKFGATVTVREPTGSEARYRIVGVDEIDSDRNWVSWLSPIARALMNAHTGGEVRFKTPRGEQKLEVVRVEYEP